ncbi:pescadillo development protein-family BRCT domain-containing protein [Syncephalis fuscata]|nr:pescadillo development protein-family BRCT domain-containing protein [Syncephalis fuscata]
MGKLKKKGTSGAAVKYITRNQALKKLQVTLADFRRICIIKGVYPREPKNKKKANKGSTAPRTFYYYKDIQYLLHEPLLNHFRDHKAYLRRVTRALAKRNLSTARALRDNRPTYSLHHIVRERYPSFIDALRDLDDALCLLFLFSTFPVSDKVKAPLVTECQRLTAEFQHYVMRAKCIKKVFLSIKGIYYQAEIKGQPITWLVPYQFVQQIPGDVDLRVMLTFLEFYRTLVGFVNYRLYSELNLVYPPKIDYTKVAEGAEVDALQIESKLFDWSKHATVTEEVKNDDEKENEDVTNMADLIEASNKRLKTLSSKLTDIVASDMKAAAAAETSGNDDMEEDEPQSLTADEFAAIEAAGEEGDVAKPLVITARLQDRSELFVNRIFYLSREVPRNSLEFVIRACGGQVGWDAILGGGSPYSDSDDRITHHICDRPQQDRQYYGRSYVQPQWVYDCINAGKLLVTDDYAPGATLPAHLSPFVQYEAGDYVPAEARLLDDTLPDTNEDEAVATEVLSEDEEQHQMELEAESAGVNFSEYQSEQSAGKKTKKLTATQKAEQEKKQMATIMMSKKDRKVYSSIRQEQIKKEATARRLQRKKDALNSSK